MHVRELYCRISKWRMMKKRSLVHVAKLVRKSGNHVTELVNIEYNVRD